MNVCVQRFTFVSFAIVRWATQRDPVAAAVPTEDEWKKIIVCDILGLAYVTLAIYPDKTTLVGCERIHARTHAAHCYLRRADTTAYGAATTHTDHKSRSIPALRRRRNQTNVRCFHYYYYLIGIPPHYNKWIQIELI